MWRIFDLISRPFALEGHSALILKAARERERAKREALLREGRDRYGREKRGKEYNEEEIGRSEKLARGI